MTITNLGSDVLTTLPDLPRWLEARGLLLSRRGFVVDTADGCRLICGRKDRVVVPVTVELSPLLEDDRAPRSAAGDDRAPGRDAAGGALPPAGLDRGAGDSLHAAGRPRPLRGRCRNGRPRRSRPSRSRRWRTCPTRCASRCSTPSPTARCGAPRWTASRCRSPTPRLATEAWFDLAVQTLEAARNRGLGRAAAMGLIVDRMLHGVRPVWKASKSNEASNRLARGLGFEPVDLVWLLTQ